MKCIHCSARVDRTDWFCPNCKRSVPRRRPLASGPVWVPVALALGAAVLTLGVLRGTRPATAPDAEVTIRELPLVQVSAQTAQLEPATATQPRRDDRNEEREAREPEATTPDQPGRTVEKPVDTLPAPAKPDGTGAITVSTDQPVQTYVYLNGGTLLGEAPLRNASIPAGKHRLVFWSPSVGGRSTRTVEVNAGENVEVVEHVRSRESFREETGG